MARRTFDETMNDGFVAVCRVGWLIVLLIWSPLFLLLWLAGMIAGLFKRA